MPDQRTSRQVIFVNFDHERARAGFARFEAACEAIRLEERHGVKLRFLGVDVTDGPALARALDRELEGSPAAIVAPSAAAVLVAMNRTQTVPIVFVTHQDPVELKLAANLAQRNSNLAGISIYLGVEAKVLELLRETAPAARRVGFIVDRDLAANPRIAQFLDDTARRHGLEWKVVPVVSIESFESDVRRAGPVDAWFVTKASALDEYRARFISVIAATRRPAIYPSQVDVDAGATMAYEAVFDDVVGAMARQLDRVLEGVNPGDIPIERPKRFTLSINVAAARRAGMRLPTELLSRADRVL